MNKHFKIIIILNILLFSNFLAIADSSEINAEESIKNAQQAIVNAENLLKAISSNSAEFEFLTELLLQAKTDWEIALTSFNEYNEAVGEIDQNLSSEINLAYEQVAITSAQVAKVHADSVILALSYLKLVSEDKFSGLEKVKQSINKISEIKQVVIDNKSYVEEVVINQISDSDGDGYSDFEEIIEQTDPSNASSYPDKQTAGTNIEQSLAILNQSMSSVIAVSSSLTEQSVEMVDVLSESEVDDLSVVEDITSSLENLTVLQSGAQERFNDITEVVESSGFNVEVNETLEELVTFIDMAAEASVNIIDGDSIDLTDSIGDVSFDMVVETDDSEDSNIPNIYTDIGQSQGYQETMNTLHDLFRESTTTVDGGGFGESNATET